MSIHLHNTLLSLFWWTKNELGDYQIAHWIKVPVTVFKKGFVYKLGDLDLSPQNPHGRKERMDSYKLSSDIYTYITALAHTYTCACTHTCTLTVLNE